LAVNTLASPAAVCAGNQSQLYAFATGGTGVYSYTWTPSATLNNPGILNPVATVTETTTYDVLVKNLLLTVNGQVTVNVEEAPGTPEVSIVTDHLVSSATTGNQWYDSQGLIPGATSQTHFPAHTETYYVIASSTAGCQSASSNEVVFGFTGTIPTTENNFSVYPNPFSGKVSIEYNVKSAGFVRIVMYNSIGNEVGIIEESEKTAGNHKASFDGSQLSPGIYFCKIFSGDTVLFAKVIKNK